MNEPDEIEASDAEESKAPAPSTASATPAKDRAEKDRLRLRERIARDQEDEVTAAFDAHAELQKSVQAAVRALDLALGQCAALERQCSSPLGRRMFLGRKLAVKGLLGVLGTALHHLKKASSGMSSVARTREPTVEEASTFGLDH